MNTVEVPGFGWSFTMSTGFDIGPIHITYYGLLIFIGFCLALVFAFTHFRKAGIDPDKALNCIIAGTFGGILGARLYYVIFSWSNYSIDFTNSDTFLKSLLHIVNITEGGLAIYGGLIGALIAGLITAKICKVNIPALLDIVGVGFLIGQGIGRWGNFVNAEAFGSNTALPWGITGPQIQNYLENANMSGVDPTIPVHPCFFYESIWCLIGFIVLFLYYKHKKFDGEIFLMYLAFYGLGRSVIEGLRTDSLMMGPVRVSQLLSIIMVIVAIAFIIKNRIQIKKGKSKPIFATTEEGQKIVNANPEKTKLFSKKEKITSDDEKEWSESDGEEN